MGSILNSTDLIGEPTDDLDTLVFIVSYVSVLMGTLSPICEVEELNTPRP